MARYVRLSIKGTLGTQEVWSVNPVIDPRGEIPGDFDQAKFNDFVQGLAAMTVPTALLTAMSSAAKITAYRAELRDTTVEGFLGAAEATLAAPKAGSGAPGAPAQASMVASLRSNSALSSGRGRLYWPALGVPIDATSLRISPTNLEAYANAFSSYLTNICTIAQNTLTELHTITFGISVYSPTKKILTECNRVMVGNVLDVQRRRRDSMPEAYQTASLP